MTLRSTLLAAAAAALGLFLAGCGAARPIKYYSLDPPAVSAAPAQLPVSLLVGHFGAPLVYRDTRIVFRTGPNEMGMYEEHRWAEPPAHMVEHMLMRALRASGQYRSVQLIASNAQGDYILRGRIERFEEISGSPLAARVALHVSLYNPKEGHTVWTKDYGQDEPVSGNDVAAVVAALNRNLQRGLVEITSGLDQYFASHPAVPASAH
jgi:ABC-type uncharacterized transport system auxiliary subunit